MNDNKQMHQPHLGEAGGGDCLLFGILVIICINLRCQLRMINSKLSLRRSEADAGASLKCYHSERHLG